MLKTIWEEVRSLFEVDDGSLPDIFIESLTAEEVVSLYNKVMSHASIYDDPAVWSIEESREMLLKELDDPASLVVQGKTEPFRHGLNQLKFDGVALPELTICVEPTTVSFDYRKGINWGRYEVEALLKFLWDLVHDLPNARVIRADEGSSQNPSVEFSRAWNAYRTYRMTSES